MATISTAYKDRAGFAHVNRAGLTWHQASITERPEGIIRNLAVIDQPYSMRLGAHIDQFYGDAPVLVAPLVQHYGDAPVLRRPLVMEYGDMLQLRVPVEQPYHINKSLLAIVEQCYTIAEKVNRVSLEQSYSLQETNPVRTLLDQVFAIEGDPIVNGLNLSVIINGQPVSFHHISVEGDLDEFFLSAEIHFVDTAQYRTIKKGDAFVATINADVFHLLVESKRKSRPGTAQRTYIVTAVSQAKRLTAPWSRPLLQKFDPGQAKDIVTDLADGIPVNWQIVDFPILADTLYANDEDRLTIIRKIVNSAGGILQSDPDGTLRVCYEYSENINKWSQATPDYYLTDKVNFISQDDTPVENPGYNKFLVGSQISATDRTWTEQRDVFALVKEVMGFQTPWDDSKSYTLDHSGGPWVGVPEYLGVVEEIYPPLDKPAERVEFVAGFANAARSIYGNLQVTWLREQLGAITWSEDGRLEAELKTGRTDGYSLAEIRYTSRYHLWRVRTDRSEEVQFIMREVD